MGVLGVGCGGVMVKEAERRWVIYIEKMRVLDARETGREDGG